MMEATCPPCRLDESDPTEKAFEKGPLDHVNLQRSNYNNTNGGKPAKKQKPWDSIYQVYSMLRYNLLLKTRNQKFQNFL